MSVVKSNNKQVDFMSLDEIRVKKFGFGSNLVTFLDVPPTEETIAIEAHASTDTGLAFQNLFNPAFNLFTDRPDISPVRDRPKIISSSQQDSLQRVVISHTHSNPEQSQITVINSSKQYVPEGFFVEFSSPEQSTATVNNPTHSIPNLAGVEFPHDDSDWIMDGVIYAAMSQSVRPHGWLNYLPYYYFSVSSQGIKNAPEEEGGLRGVTTVFNEQYKFLHGLRREGGPRESFSITVSNAMSMGGPYNVAWAAGSVYLTPHQSKLDYIFRAGPNATRAYKPYVNISMSPPEETTIVRYGLNYNFESYTIEYKEIKRTNQHVSPSFDDNWRYWFSTEKIIGDRCFRDGRGNCDENQNHSSSNVSKTKFAKIVRSSPNHPNRPSVPWLSDPEILTSNTTSIATAQGSSYTTRDGRIIRMGNKNVPSWNGLHDPERDDIYQDEKDFTNKIDGLKIFNDSSLWAFNSSCSSIPFFETQIPLGHSGGEAPEWRSDGSNPTNDSSANPYNEVNPKLYKFRVKANYVARQADGDLIDVWSGDYKEDVISSVGINNLDKSLYAPEDQEGLKFLCENLSYNSVNLG